MKELIPYLACIGISTVQYFAYKEAIKSVSSKIYDIGYKNGYKDAKSDWKYRGMIKNSTHLII